MGCVRNKIELFQKNILINFNNYSDDESPDPKAIVGSLQGPPVGPNPFLDIPQNVTAVEYKKGYVMRKCCYDSQNKKSMFTMVVFMGCAGTFFYVLH